MSLSQIFFLSAFFLIQVQSNVLSLGALSGIALSSSGLEPVGAFALTQALAMVLAILIYQRFFSTLNNRWPILWCLIGTIAASCMTSLSKTGTLSWYTLVFCRLLSGYIPAAAIVGIACDILGKSSFITAKRIQLILSAASLVGIAIGPIIFRSDGIAFGFKIDALVIFISSLLFVYSTRINIDFAFSKIGRNNMIGLSSHFSCSYKLISSLLILTLPIWIPLGLLNIVEVPFLIHFYSASPEFISLLFLLTCVAALTTTFLMPADFFAKNSRNIVYFSGLFMVTTGYLIIISRNTLLLFTLSVFLGIANGIFNLSAQNLTQSSADSSKRAIGFLTLRLAVPLGMIVASGFILTTSFDFTNTIYFLLFSLVSMASGSLYFLILNISKQRINLSLGFFALGCTLLMRPGNCLASDINVISLPLREIPISLDPSSVVDASAAFVEHQIYQGLYRYTEANTLVPSLAKSHVISADGRTFTIKIDTDRSFSDGTKNTALIVYDSILHTLSTLGVKASWAFGDVDGFDKFLKSKNSLSLTGIKVLDQETIQFHLVRSFSQFLQVLTSPNFVIVRRYGNNIFGTGPYVPIAKDSDKLVLNIRRDLQFNKSAPQEIHFLRSPDYDSTVNLAKNGQIDIFQAPGIQSLYLPRFISKKFNFLQVVLLFINTESKEFGNKNERCEFAAALKAKIVTQNEQWLSASKGLPYGWNFFNDQVKVPTNYCPKRHRSVLFTNSAALFRETQLEDISKSFKSQGCNISFEKSSVHELFSKMDKGEFSAAMIGFIPDYLDPDALIFPVLKTGQLYNWSRYSSEAIDTLLVLNRQITDQNSRDVIVKAIMDKIDSDCPISVLGSQPGTIFYSEKIIDPKINGLGFHMIDLDQLRFKEEKL